MTKREAIIATVKRWSDIVDGKLQSTDMDYDCHLCEYAGISCSTCPCVIVFDCHCKGRLIRDDGRPAWDLDAIDTHYPRTYEEKLMAACMIASVYGIEVEE